MGFIMDKKHLIILTALCAAGCSGESSTTSNTGVFLDSEVGGLKYSTNTLNGTTNANGEFQYIDGETVTFSIGDVNLPATPASSILTPLEIFNTQDVNDVSVVNAARLLQSLDVDGDPTNGISIAEAAHASATGLTLDFSSSTFESDVTNLVANSGSVTKVLIDEATAISHLQDTLADLPDTPVDTPTVQDVSALIGSWYIPSNNKTLITFIDDTNYFVTQEIGADEPLCSDGMESGTYTWDSLTGSISFTNVIDTTGDCGLTAAQGDSYTPTSTSVADNTFTINDAEGAFSLSKVTDANNPIIGGWYVPSNNKTLVAFIDATNYFVTQEIGVDEPLCSDGMESGTYTWDSATGSISFTNVIDTTGDCGLTSAEGGTYDATITVNADAFTITDIEGSFSLNAVK